MNKGIAAIITVIILGAVMVLIGTTMTLTSISEGQATVTETKFKKNQTLLDACTEESLITINKDNTLPSTITTTLGSCNIIVNSQVGTSWDFTLETSDTIPPLKTNIILNRESTINISSWLDQ